MRCHRSFLRAERDSGCYFASFPFASFVGYIGGSDQSMLSVAAALAIGAVYLITKRALYATLFTSVFLVALISLSA